VIQMHSAEQIREAEEAAFRVTPEGTLMQRASHALAVSCANLLSDVRGAVVGSRVVLLVGSGNNGGDALWAGSMLAGRGCRVDAITLSDRFHATGAAALRAQGGRLSTWIRDDEQKLLLERADLVIDGILGIGGSGPLRADASQLAADVRDSGALVVSVDVPSGVDADTGAVPGAAIRADVTVTFGAMKPGLLVSPGCFHAGAVRLIEIGLDFAAAAPVALALNDIDVAMRLPEPEEDAYKYSRGVVGLAVGSAPYRGAALLATAGARHADVGMVRLLDRLDGVAPMVVAQYPDVVIDGAAPAEQVRATAWACGSGFIGDADDESTVLAVLSSRRPVVLDAGALTVVAASARVRELIAERWSSSLPTVLTPHEGEFERLCPDLLNQGRLSAARAAARSLSCIIVLKGAGTIVVGPSGPAFIDTEGGAELGVAGSGDILTGLVAALLARARVHDPRHEVVEVVEVVAVAVWLHGLAGRLAAHDGPVTAPDIAGQVRRAVQVVRSGAAP
jgi:hydroxyethylthiazole kinase-like uncharacterized protein yjeF